MPLNKKFVLLFIVLTSLAALVGVIKLTNCDCVSNAMFKGITIGPDSDEGKWALLRKLLLYISLFIFAHTSFVMMYRMLKNKSSPATVPDPAIVNLFNRIITNTIQQSVIFLGLFVYFLIDGPVDKLKPSVIMNIGVWFMLGRVLFSLGYVVGTLIGFPQLRAYGFTLSIFVDFLLLEHIFLAEPCVSTFLLGL